MSARSGRWRSPRAALATVLALSAIACGPVEGMTDAGQPTDAAVPDAWTDPDLAPDLIAARPYGLHVPASVGSDPVPLVLTLHGFGSSATEQVDAFDLLAAADRRGFVLAYPDGTEVRGTRAWNASCCGALPISVDDVRYLRAVIADAAQRAPVDRRRIYVHGMSNGGFMAHLLACQAADVVAAIVALAGTMWVGEDTACQPAAPVAVLHGHGTADTTVAYDGGTFMVGLRGVDYISAPDVVEVWRQRNGCAPGAAISSADYLTDIAGAETEVQSYTEGCTGHGAVVHWKAAQAEHVASFSQAFVDDSLDFLLAHPKPE